MDRRTVSRRVFLGSAAVAALGAVVTACTRVAIRATQPTKSSAALPGCVVRPALTEGPYFVDEKMNRSDIREDRPGKPLLLTIKVSKVSGSSCAPLVGAQVDVWHCDAGGLYSDEQQNGTAGKKFCRGYQITGQDGVVQFNSIYPGWYMGRTIHIHFKIRSGSSEFTSQLFFDESLNDTVMSLAPYNTRGQRDQRNGTDGIFNRQMILPANISGDGFAGTFEIGLQS